MNLTVGSASCSISFGTMLFRSGEDIQQEIIFRPAHDPDKPPPHKAGDATIVISMMIGAVVGGALGAALAVFASIGNMAIDIALGAVIFGILGTLLGDRIKGLSRPKVAVILLTPILAVTAGILILSRQTLSTLSVQAIPDDDGGAIVAWQSEDGIYAQRLDASGRTLWQTGGILVHQQATAVDPNVPGGDFFTLIEDGAGGAIITTERRNSVSGPFVSSPINTFSQRISPDGRFLWGDGVSIGQRELIASSGLAAIPDGTGGAIFIWNDYRTYFAGLHDDFLKLQKVSADGRMLWGNEGILVVASSPYHPPTDQEKAGGVSGIAVRSWPTYTGHHVIIGDGAQGAIAIWHEEDAPSRTFNIYARRVDADGQFAWENPLLLKTVSSFPVLSMASYANGTISLAVHVSDPGPTAWLVNFSIDGAEISEHVVLNAPLIIDDGEGGFITLRTEGSPTGGPPTLRRVSLYLNRLDSNGNYLWPDGPIVTTESGMYPDPAAVGEGTGGAVLTWRLARMEDFTHGRLFAVGLNAEGNITWGEGGLAVFDDPGLEYQGRPKIIATDSGAIVIAAVGKGAKQGDMIYAQKLDETGQRLWGDGVRIDR